MCARAVHHHEFQPAHARHGRFAQARRPQPTVKRDSDYFLKTIGNIKSIDAFLVNDRVYRYAMKAFGLSDMIYAKAFVRKVLTDGIDSNRSFANQLADPRFRDLAATFNFKSFGTATTSLRQGAAGRCRQVPADPARRTGRRAE